jgi:hypothetical protein
VHKGSTQTNKKIKLGFKKKGAKKPKCALVWRTGLSGAPGLYKSKLFTFGFLCPVCHWTVWCTKRSNGYRRNGRLHSAPDSVTVCGRSQSRGQRCTGLSGATRSQRSNGRLRQNPNGWVTWLAHRTVSGGGCFGG